MKQIMYSMSERLVDIPITKILRDEIKTLKRKQTYNEFLENLIASQWK